MHLAYLTRQFTAPQGLPQVYIACHPADRQAYIGDTARRLLRLQNCAVWYDDGAEPDAPGQLEDALAQMQLIVFPVTERLLCQPCRARDQELPFALRRNIPVLPLMEQPGLREKYGRVFGPLQSLDPRQQDAGADSFEKKLGDLLDRVLLPDTLRTRITAAFDGQIFLSYRKKDRPLARRLMERIHDREPYQALAIWYDEYLTPGEDFHGGIARAMQASDLVLLAVTPHLVIEENFVQKTEYPEARRLEKPVLPVELAPTDRAELARQYDALPEIWDASDEEPMLEALGRTLAGAGVRLRARTPERDYLIGMAFLTGTGVEPDRDRGLSLISAAAEAGWLEAIIRLREMYRLSEHVPLDFVRAVHWAQRAETILAARCGQENASLQARVDWMYAARSLGDLARQQYGLGGPDAPRYRKLAADAYETAFRAVPEAERLDGDVPRTQAIALSRLGLLSAGTDGQKALACLHRAQELFSSLHSRRGTDQSTWDMAEAAYDLGRVYERNGDTGHALLLYKRARDVLYERRGSGNPGLVRNLGIFSCALGKLLYRAGHRAEARQYLDESIRILLPLQTDVSEQVPLNVTESLCAALSVMGDIQAQDGAPEQAEYFYALTLRLCMPALTGPAFARTFQYVAGELYRTSVRLGNDCVRAGWPDLARRHFMTGADALRVLYRYDPSAQTAAALADIERVLGQL